MENSTTPTETTIPVTSTTPATTPPTPNKPKTPDGMITLIWVNMISIVIAYFLTFDRTGVILIFFWPVYIILLPVVASFNLYLFTKYILKKQGNIFLRFVGLCLILLSIGYVGYFIYNKVRGEQKLRERSIPLSREEAVALITDCKIERIIRGKTEKSFTMVEFRNLPKSESRIAFDSDFDALAKAAFEAYDKCGDIPVSHNR